MQALEDLHYILGCVSLHHLVCCLGCKVRGSLHYYNTSCVGMQGLENVAYMAVYGRMVNWKSTSLSVFCGGGARGSLHIYYRAFNVYNVFDRDAGIGKLTLHIGLCITHFDVLCM